MKESCLFFNKPHIGGILIEFTFCIPVLMVLLLFVNDHYRFHELRDKVKTSAYLAASMIQNVSNARANRRLTGNDLKNITLSSTYNFFHTNSMFYSRSCPFGLRPYVLYYYVKRENGVNYLRSWRFYPENSGVEMRDSAIKTSSIDIESINPDLYCYNDGEERVVIRYVYMGHQFSKSKLGLFLLTPKATDCNGNVLFCSLNDYRKNYNIFTYDFVFVPKPGLFPLEGYD